MEFLDRIVFGRCPENKYEEFEAAASIEFGYKPGWFASHGGNIFPSFTENEKELKEQNYIVTYLDEIIAGVGIYPMKILADRKIFNVAGVGTVFVKAKHREKGIMTYLLNKVNEIVNENEFDLSWLWGKYSRYKRFGYEYGGGEFEIDISQESFAHKIKVIKGFKCVLAKKEDLDTIIALYDRNSIRTIRNYDLWIRHFYRKNLTFNISDNLIEKGYIITDSDDPEKVLEAQGDANAVIALLYNHIANNNLNNIKVYLSKESTQTLRQLLEICQDYRINHSYQFAIGNELAFVSNFKNDYDQDEFERIQGDLKDSYKYGYESFLKPLVRPIYLYVPRIDRV